jgi:hypothetical protein
MNQYNLDGLDAHQAVDAEQRQGSSLQQVGPARHNGEEQ